MTIISTESWVVATELMLKDALTALSLTIPIYEIYAPEESVTLPALFVDDWNITMHLNTVSGSIDVIYLISVDGTITPQQNLIIHRNNLFNLYSTLKTMARKDGYLIEPTIEMKKGVGIDAQAFAGSNTQAVWGAFTINFGLQQSG